MLKRMMLGAALAVMCLSAVPAEARTSFNLYMGTPYYPYQMYPHYRYYEGRGWYDPYGYENARPYRMSCWDARQLVKDQGYNNVRVLDCEGRIYAFEGKRHGHRVIINVNPRNGNVWRD